MKKTGLLRLRSMTPLTKKLHAGALALASLLPSSALAQQQNSILSPLAGGYLDRARLMMSDLNFSGAADQIEMMLPDEGALSAEQRAQVRYMLALALYQRADERCVTALKNYVANYPASSRAIEAQLIIGDYYFFSGKFAAALKAYHAVDISALNKADRLLYTYREALSRIKLGLCKEARPAMTMLQREKAYAPAATFYLAYIDYSNGSYDAAYEGFEESARLLQDAYRSSRGKFDPTGLDAAYYLAQIEFTRGKYRDVVERGESLLQKGADASMAAEINRILGESYFKLGNESAASRYLSAYEAAAGQEAVASAIYTLGVIDYNNGDISRAAERFALLTELRDPIGQSAYLYLGQCAVRQGDDSSAALSFEKAYKMDFDSNVTETALYNYVAARTRGGNIPFGSSVEMLEDFLNRFPRSEFASQVEEYLATAFYNEKNYARALQSINRIKRPGQKVMAAKQNILYMLGVEALTNNNASDAASYMEQTIKLGNYNKELANQAYLWLGDARYAEGQYAAAASAYETFLKTEKRSSNRTMAIYDLAYALYQQRKYPQAITRFSEALSSSPALSAALIADATVRRADCRYYNGDASGALADYTAALAKGAPDPAYAAFRRAVMLGIKGDAAGKVKELDALAQKYPDSKWLAAAMLEKGLTFSGSAQNAKASEALEEVTRRWPDAPEARRAMLQLALNDAATGRAEQAEEEYKEVIKRWPASDEAALAHEDLRLIYARNGRLAEYQSFLNSIKGAPTLTDSDVERLAYDAAANALAANPDDVKQLDAFVNKYPNSKYLAQALLDLALARYDAGRTDDALAYTRRLLASRASSPQVPEALLLQAQILEDSGQDAEALAAYRQLLRRGGTDFATDAYGGIMRLSDNASERLSYARKLRQSGGLSPEQSEEASFYEAEALLSSGNPAAARSILLELSANPTSLYGAKAVVGLGEFYLSEGKYAEAERLLKKFTDEGTSHDYELARGYIALADAYKALGKTYLGIEYLKSLKDNYPGTEQDIHDMINQRLKTWK